MSTYGKSVSILNWLWITIINSYKYFLLSTILKRSWCLFCRRLSLILSWLTTSCSGILVPFLHLAIGLLLFSRISFLLFFVYVGYILFYCFWATDLFYHSSHSNFFFYLTPILFIVGKIFLSTVSNSLCVLFVSMTG